MDQVKNTQKAVVFEGLASDLEGNEVRLSHNLIPVPNDDGSLDYITVVSSDITERTKAEKKLKEYREHLEELVEKRTKEVHKKAQEQQQLFDMMIGREVRMAGLKNTIEQLRQQLKENGIEPVANDPLLE